MVAKCEKVPAIISYNTLNICSQVATWQIKNLHHHNAYGHKTYQGGENLQGATTNKPAWFLNKEVMEGHVIS